MNTDNAKVPNKPNHLLIKLSGQLDLVRPRKVIALANLSLYYTWPNIAKRYNNNLIAIKGPDFDELVQYSDGSYSFKAIQKAIYNRNKDLDPTIKESKPPICLYVNETSNRITLHLDKNYSIDFKSPEMMRVMGADKQKYSGPYDTDLPYVPHLEK